MAFTPTRREFVKIGAMSAGALLLLKERAWAAFAQTSPGLIKFGPGQELRRFGLEIPLATTPDVRTYSGVDYYEIAMREFTDKLHPALPPTPLRGYGNAADALSDFRHLGGAIVAQQGRPVRVKWVNQLDPGNVKTLGKTGIPVDSSVITEYGINVDAGNDRAAPHLHGGLVPWPSDGGPFHWFNNPTNGGSVKGPSVSGAVATWLDGTDDYWYPNNQTPRFMWYHDHAVGITRLNAYAGLATGYILVDPDSGGDETILMQMLGIPGGLGIHGGAGGVVHLRQIPLVVQDKVFSPNLLGASPSPSDLWYPETYDTQFFGLTRKGALPLPDPSLVPEFWGDTMLVNGTVYPFVRVEPRRYRIRILNACNTRFLSLRLVRAMGRTFPDNTEPDIANPGPVMTVIGSEGGLLDGTSAPKGVVYDNALVPLVLAPAERADIIIDFSGVSPNKFNLPFILYNDAPVPFPGGTPLADFFPQNRKLAVPPAPGYGPNTRTLLQFQVVPLGELTGDTSPDEAVNPEWVLPPSPPPAVTVPGTRELGLYETIDHYGRLAQNLGDLAGDKALIDPPTENLAAGSVEVWEVFNLSADTHPIHFHYVNVRVLDRQPFSWKGGMPSFTAPPIPPEPYELGWKETVRMNPGECTRLLVEIPPLTGLAPEGSSIPESPRLAASPYSMSGAHEYVWHCHILEHEEHDMMRPLIVQE